MRRFSFIETSRRASPNAPNQMRQMARRKSDYSVNYKTTVAAVKSAVTITTPNSNNNNSNSNELQQQQQQQHQKAASWPIRCFKDRIDVVRLWIMKRENKSCRSQRTSESNQKAKKSEKVCKRRALEDVLQHPESLVAFRNFLKKEHSEENLDFLLKVQKYKQRATKHRAAVIYATFIEEQAKKEINIDSRTKKNIAENLNKPDKDLFDEASSAVVQLLRTDSFQRFRKAHACC